MNVLNGNLTYLAGGRKKSPTEKKSNGKKVQRKKSLTEKSKTEKKSNGKKSKVWTPPFLTSTKVNITEKSMILLTIFCTRAEKKSNGKKVLRKKSPTEKKSNGKKVQRKKSPTEKK